MAGEPPASCRDRQELVMTGGQAVGLAGIDLMGVLDTLSDPAIAVGEDLSILAVNRSCAETFAPREQLLGRRCHEVLHRLPNPCDRPGEHCPLRRFQDTGEPCRVVHVHHTAGGDQHQEITVYPILDHGGELRSFLEIFRPVPIASAHPSRDRLAGRSAAFNQMLAMILRIAPRQNPVLLLGETGTGKERVARTIHRLSPRSAGAFAQVDCAGLDGLSFNRELFGWADSQSPGIADVPGKVDAARGGTLFLDDVGDLSLSQQRELRRLLKTRTYRRVGSSEPLTCDFRLICAHHPELREKVAEGTFLDDLYYRISIFPIELPPLRERLDDLPLLAESLLRQMGYGEGVKIHPRTLAVLARYPFPGNLRELRNLLEHACLEAGDGLLLPEHLPSGVRRFRPPAGK